MKIKCYIPSFSCPDYLYQTLDALANCGHDIDFSLYVAGAVDRYRLPENKSIMVRQYGKEIGHGLVHQFYDELKKEVDNYDVFIYTEDDIEITPEVFGLFLKHNQLLDDEHVIGVLRYEPYEGRLYLNEFQPGTPHSIAPQLHNINGKQYVSYNNVHQGCFMLERRNIKKLLSNPEFVKTWPTNTVMLEDAASNVYKSTWPGNIHGLTKLHPVEDVDKLIVHHLSNRHTSITRNFLQLHEVVEQVKLCLTHSPAQ